MDDIIRKLQSTFTDSMQTLPFLLTGLLFFIGTLTANTGMLLMIISVVLGINGLGFLLNLKPYTQQGPFMIVRIILSLISIFTVRYAIPYTKDEKGITKDVVLGIAITSYLIHAIIRIFFGNIAGQEGTSGQCSIIGQSKTAAANEEEFSSPSLWLISTTYILGFIFANAVDIFNLPTPTVTEESIPDAKQRAQQQKLVNDRVTNRVMQSIFVMITCSLVFAFALWYRFNLTQCEQPFVTLIFPIIFVIVTAFSLYYYIKLNCGVNPADIFGIVYDMVHPDVVNNPIVCMTK